MSRYDREEATKGDRLRRAIIYWFRNLAATDVKSIDKMDAVSLINNALLDTISYMKYRNDGNGVDRRRENALSRRWLEVSNNVYVIDSELAHACMMKSLGWTDPEYWEKARGGGLRISVDDMINAQKELAKNIGRTSSDILSGIVDLTTHKFSIALSFPSEVRHYVAEVVRYLDALVGPNAYFYDHNYVSQLAVPSLDLLLQDIYRNRSDLLVVFSGSDYERKDWCGVEFRAIREILLYKDNQRVMLVRMDDGRVRGIFAIDGYIDSREYSPKEIAAFIVERSRLIENRS